MRIRTIDVRGARIRVVEDGPAAAGAVLLVHGVGGWAENWRETIAALAARGLRGVAMDLPGFGESARVPMRYFEGDVPGYARFVAELMDALALDRAHLVGHSLGGAVAYLAAVCAPERFRSLTLVAPGGLGEDIPWPLRLATVPLIGVLVRRRREAARAGLRSCFHDPGRIPAALLEECDRYAGSFPETLRVLRAGVTLRGIKRSLRRRWLSCAGNYPGPALIVWGEQDRVLPSAHLAHVAELFPHARVRTIPAAGHLVMVERPEAFASVLSEFLDGAAAERNSQQLASAHN